ncbi:MAG: FAD-dependent oxidoreductase [Acidimicrobiales bacterium]
MLVVGAGAAGLVAAWRAAEAGRSVRVIERSSFVGGMAASIEIAGQRVDLGSHRLHASIAPYLFAAIQSRLGGDLQLRRRNGRLRLRDRWVRFPLRPGDLVRQMPRGLAAHMLADACTRPARRPGEDTFAEVVRCRFGRSVLDEFYGPYAQKLWGTDAAALSGELARRRIATKGAGSLVRRVVQRGDGPGRTFWYPRRGYGQIVEAMAQTAVDAGATIECNASIQTITPRGDGVAVVLDSGDTFDSERVLWTAPLGALVDVVDDAPETVRASVARLDYRAMLLVYIVVDRPQYTSFDAHYIPTPGTPVTRLSEPKNYRDGPDPTDRTVLCAEIPCRVGDAWWTASDATLAQAIVDMAALVGLPPIEIAAIEVRRLPRVYPIYTPAASAALDVVQRWVETLPGVVTFGRQALFVPDNLHHVMAMGWDAGELAAHAAWDRAEWAAANARYAAHVVDD